MCYALVPWCQMTEQRMAKAMELIDKAIHACEKHGSEFEEELEQMEALKAEFPKYSLWGHRRDTAYMHLEGLDCGYRITGGMSWGDPPTDMYDIFNAVTLVDGLWGWLEEWGAEDYEKGMQHGS
jgi:hypothetical protein